MTNAAEKRNAEIRNLVKAICGTKSTSCRGLDKAENALRLLALDGIKPEDVRIYEIPLDWDNQVLIMFEYHGKDYEAFFGVEEETNEVYGGEYSENIFDKDGDIFEQIPIDAEDIVNTKRMKKEVVSDIEDIFKDDEELFANCIEQLDDYNGWLNDNRYFPMYELDEFYRGEEPTEILYRAFYGYDADSWTTDSYGARQYGAFNPNREWFSYNGYGNLVSSDWKDYSDLIDSYVIDSMSDNRYYIDAIEEDETLSALFDELEDCLRMQK